MPLKAKLDLNKDTGFIHHPFETSDTLAKLEKPTNKSLARLATVFRNDIILRILCSKYTYLERSSSGCIFGLTGFKCSGVYTNNEGNITVILTRQSCKMYDVSGWHDALDPVCGDGSHRVRERAAGPGG